MPESTINPPSIEIDKVTDGKLRLICRWNISTVERTNDDGITQTIYTYDESVLSWALPAQYIPAAGTETQISTMADIKNYIESVSDEIMSFAKGIHISLTPDDENKKINYSVPIYKNYPELFSNAQNTVNNALVQYNEAVVNYTTALAAYNAAGIPVSTANAVAHIVAVEAQIVAAASAIQAAANAITALVSVVTVLAENQKIIIN